MSYERMLETEQRLQQEIDELLAAAEHADEDCGSMYRSVHLPFRIGMSPRKGLTCGRSIAVSSHSW